MIFYKNKLHEEGTKKLLKKFQTPSISANKERAAFSYLVGATNRIESVIACFDENNMIDLNLLIETIERKDFSSSEKSMLKFAIQFINQNISNITLTEVMNTIDDNNITIIKQAIDIRY